MPQLDAILIGEQYRAALEARQREALSRLIAAYRVMLNRLDGYITALESELSAMEGSGQKPKVWKVKKLERYGELKKQIEGEMTRYAALLEAEIDAGARDAIDQAVTESRATAKAALPGLEAIDAAIMSRWNILPAGAVEAMIGFLSPDSPLRERLRTMLGPSLAELVSEKLIEGIGLGYNPRKVASIIRRELGQGLAWSLRTARTSMIYAHREALRAHYVANQEIVPRYRRTSTKDGRVCLACIALDGTEYPVTEPLMDHYHGRCLTPGTLVSGPPARAFVSRHYQGEVVTIRTAAGQLLSVTPKHPIMTIRGWIAAGVLRPGMMVLALSKPVLQGRAIEELFEVAARGGITKLMGHPAQFHGDGQSGENAMIACPSVGYRADEQVVHSRGNADHQELMAQCDQAIRLLVRRATRRVDTYPHRVPGYMSDQLAQQTDCVFGRAVADHIPVAVPCALRGNGHLHGDGPLGPLARMYEPVTSRTLHASRNAVASEPLPIPDAQVSTAAELDLSYLNYIRGLGICLDRVVHVQRQWYRGHVYNLQTEVGWYIANGIITHNCHMEPIPLTYRDLGIDVDEPPDADTYLRGLPEEEQKRLVGPERWKVWSRGALRFSETGKQWFERQNEFTQRLMMGPGKLKHWKEGRFGWDDMVDWHDDAVYGRMSVEATLSKMLGDLVGAMTGDRR